MDAKQDVTEITSLLSHSSFVNDSDHFYGWSYSLGIRSCLHGTGEGGATVGLHLSVLEAAGLIWSETSGLPHYFQLANR